MSFNLDSNGIDDDSRAKARNNRELKNNPLDFEPGMEDKTLSNPFEDANDNPFAQDSSKDGGLGGLGSSDPFGSLSDPFSSGLGGSSSNPFGSTSDPFSSGLGSSSGWGNSGGLGGMSGFGEPPKEQKSTEDKVFEAAGTATKTTLSIVKDLTLSFKTFGLENRVEFGYTTIISSAVLSVIGLLFMIFSFGGSLGIGLLVGGLISLATGVVVFSIFHKEFREKMANGELGVEESETSNPMMNTGFAQMETPSFNDNLFDTSSNEDLFKIEDDEELEDEWEDEWEEDDETDNYGSEESVKSEDSLNGVLERIERENIGTTVTRSYLYDVMMEVLPHITKTFNEVRYIDEDSDEFDTWDAIVQNSSEILTTNEKAELLQLISLQETLFYYKLEITREKWLKNIDMLVNEIVNIYRYNPETGQINENAYGTGHTVGNKVYVTIMKGEGAIISLKDMMVELESDIKNVDNRMPVIIGVDKLGKPLLMDMYKIQTMLVSGMPRSGKTWFILFLILQLAMFKRPSELNFHIIDPKEQLSDFSNIKLPHVKKFVSTMDTAIKELKNIVDVIGPKRKDIIGKAGFVKIEDYNKANPDKKIPYLYVIVDEVMSIAYSLDSSSDTKGEFQRMLGLLVSQYPAAGIRLFIIPHLVKDSIIKKDVSQLIPFRVSVKGDANHIEQATGDRKFEHKLTHEGDMALRRDTTAPVEYVHAGVIARNNEELKAVFDFVCKMWLKIEPESYKGSILEKDDLRNSKLKNVTLTDEDVHELLSISNTDTDKNRNKETGVEIPSGLVSSEESVFDTYNRTEEEVFMNSVPTVKTVLTKPKVIEQTRNRNVLDSEDIDGLLESLNNSDSKEKSLDNKESENKNKNDDLDLWEGL